MSIGRPPKVPANYLGKAQELLHLSRAIESDFSRPKAWRDRIVSSIVDLANELLRAPTNVDNCSDTKENE